MMKNIMKMAWTSLLQTNTMSLIFLMMIWMKVLLNCDKNHTRMSASHVSSWFCSHPAGSYPRDQGRTIDPDQDRLFQNLTISPWHHSQVRRYHHPMTAHIFNKIKPHHPSRTTSSSRALQAVLKRSPVGFLLKSTEILPRSRVQD